MLLGLCRLNSDNPWAKPCAKSSGNSHHPQPLHPWRRRRCWPNAPSQCSHRNPQFQYVSVIGSKSKPSHQLETPSPSTLLPRLDDHPPEDSHQPPLHLVWQGRPGGHERPQAVAQRPASTPDLAGAREGGGLRGLARSGAVLLGHLGERH